MGFLVKEGAQTSALPVVGLDVLALWHVRIIMAIPPFHFDLASFLAQSEQALLASPSFQ